MALLPPRKDLNSSTLVGIATGMLLIVFSVLLSADEPGVFLNLPGLLIVIGGTIAATFISYPMKELRQVYRSFRLIWRHHELPVDREIEEIVRVSILLGHGRLSAIEDALTRINNPFLRTGIQLVIDRTPPSDIDALLKWRIFKLRRQEWGEAQVFRSMAAFAPAFGMAGTLLGLVNMLQSMDSADFRVVGLNLGIALTTTLYGIILANLLLKPVAIKLERRTEQRVMLMYMVLEGISMLGQKRNPSFIRETLNSFVAQYEDEIHSPSLEEIEQRVEAENDGVAAGDGRAR
ncbi:motility protein A [Sedimenticola thiotaurini]|uniref:Chemotaxis protein MotA n=1 Tax=Sedimenticola thiotaurini TaxID=1543721 RepID=A0A0F7JXL2_9GAMM|nr:MotA/TolQ/ExbB proton channel family protein [Sedimenticola thiotaurini]AKH21211.1 chemotaxis protein MotA [Sedimenticola thiotaurini]